MSHIENSYVMSTEFFTLYFDVYMLILCVITQHLNVLLQTETIRLLFIVRNSLAYEK